jgi:hypothetical protein
MFCRVPSNETEAVCGRKSTVTDASHADFWVRGAEESQPYGRDSEH